MTKYLKILTWNCQGAFRRKFEFVSKFDADIYIIQECENPEVSIDKNYRDWAQNFLWTGDIKHKGLGIFARTDIMINDLKWESNGLKHFISCRVNDEINLVAVWTHHNNSITFRYIGQFWKYLQINKHKMDKCIIVGDFNSNKIWDKNHRESSHSIVVDELESIGIRSLYHEYYQLPQGDEPHPTLYLQRKIPKPYHIDYIFACRDLFPEIESLEIGVHEDWLSRSDHMPFVATITIASNNL